MCSLSPELDLFHIVISLSATPANLLVDSMTADPLSHLLFQAESTPTRPHAESQNVEFLFIQFTDFKALVGFTGGASEASSGSFFQLHEDFGENGQINRLVPSPLGLAPLWEILNPSLQMYPFGYIYSSDEIIFLNSTLHIHQFPPFVVCGNDSYQRSTSLKENAFTHLYRCEFKPRYTSHICTGET